MFDRQYILDLITDHFEVVVFLHFVIWVMIMKEELKKDENARTRLLLFWLFFLLQSQIVETSKHIFSKIIKLSIKFDNLVEKIKKIFR
jgi:hypothetical protein